MTNSTITHWIAGIVAILIVVVVTGVGVFFGWLMDQDILPPFGGGWRCYIEGVEFAWLMVLVPLSPVIVVNGSKWLCKLLFA